MTEPTNNSSRPPIVVVMGHIDHGKTTLLDNIRKSSIAASETGGITQHIGAYEVEHAGKKITFIDTPGHEAFSKMRSRGAKVADLAVLVVAADDGVRPQTKEALAAINTAGIPFAVAINKIDKPSADIERTKSALAEAGVFLEGRGGNVPYAEISAKQGTGIDKLLETIILLAELEDLKCDPKTFASGVVIESHLDQKRGITSTLLLVNGVLRTGEYVVAAGTLAKVKILENFQGEVIREAWPSSPAVVVGFDKLPPVGAEFRSYFSQKEAMEEQKSFKEKNKRVFSGYGSSAPAQPGGKKAVLGIVIKSDVAGSAEAIEHEISKINTENVDVRILRAEAGEVSEDDVKMASSAERSVVLAFKVGVPQPARELAKMMDVEVQKFEIIYELADFLKKKIEEIAPKSEQAVVLGKAQVLKIFKAGGKNQIIGGKITEGSLKKGAKIIILRRENKIGEGSLENLQSGKINVPDAGLGQEFGAAISSKISVAAGDILEAVEK